MISFVSSSLLEKQAYCKLMLKYDICNYFRQLTKTLSLWFQRNAIHRLCDVLQLRLN